MRARREHRGTGTTLGAGLQVPRVLFSADVGSPAVNLEVRGLGRVQKGRLQVGSAPGPSQFGPGHEHFPPGGVLLPGPRHPEGI